MQLNSITVAREQAAAEVSFLNQVYGWMTGALMLTGLVAWLTFQNFDVRQARGLFLGAMIAEVLLVLAISFLANRLPVILTALAFIAYSALTGFTLSVVFLNYRLGSVATTFYVTAGTFAAMSVYGLVTRRDLTSVGNLCFMGLIGLILASIVNLFLGNGLADLVISGIGILVFVGLTAYDTQKLKRLHESGAGTGGQAIVGALTLYLDFINLFLYLLRFVGKRR